METSSALDSQILFDECLPEINEGLSKIEQDPNFDKNVTDLISIDIALVFFRNNETYSLQMKEPLWQLSPINLTLGSLAIATVVNIVAFKALGIGLPGHVGLQSALSSVFALSAGLYSLIQLGSYNNYTREKTNALIRETLDKQLKEEKIEKKDIQSLTIHVNTVKWTVGYDPSIDRKIKKGEENTTQVFARTFSKEREGEPIFDTDGGSMSGKTAGIDPIASTDTKGSPDLEEDVVPYP